MKIDNHADWQSVAGCCCVPDIPPAPTVETETIRGICVPKPARAHLGEYYRRYRFDYAGGGWKQWDVPGKFEGYITSTGNKVIANDEVFTESEGGQSGEITITKSLPFTVDEAYLEAIPAIFALIDWENDSLSTGSGMDVYNGDNLDIRYMRYRFKIPPTFTGSLYKITWDAYRIANWFSTLKGPFVEIVGDETYEWTGPGNLGDPNDAGWFSPWFDMAQVMVDDAFHPPADDSDGFHSYQLGNGRYQPLNSSPQGFKPGVFLSGYEEGPRET